MKVQVMEGRQVCWRDLKGGVSKGIKEGYKRASS